jgi:DNA-binding SARP family transcriptional activator
MDFNILGPLEIIEGQAPIIIDSAKRRGLLCGLISHANDVVALDNLIEWIWQGPAPPQATSIVQAHISRLRRILEPNRAPWGASELIQRRSPGYLLKVDPEQIDSMRFQRLVSEGRAALESGDPHRAATLLAAGLRVWRGRGCLILSRPRNASSRRSARRRRRGPRAGAGADRAGVPRSTRAGLPPRPPAGTPR